MRKSLLAATVAGVATLGFWASPSIAQDDTDQKFGTVHFATSCNETAQRRFDRAMRYQHSFWYQASREIFEETLKADPTCGIAYWGMALGLLDNPHNPIPAPNLPLGLAAIQAAQATGAKTQRERDYIDALAVMYVDYDKTTHQARVQSYLKAMEALADLRFVFQTVTTDVLGEDEWEKAQAPAIFQIVLAVARQPELNRNVLRDVWGSSRSDERAPSRLA